MFETSIVINGEVCSATVALATLADRKELAGWSERFKNPDPANKDIIEYTEDVLDKWLSYNQKGRCPSDWQDYPNWIRDNPHAEVAGLFALKSSQTGKKVLGFIFVRRVWDNNLALDLLAARPELNKTLRGGLKVKGIGTALFVATCQVAANIDAKSINAEATALSSGFYTRLLGTEIGSFFAVTKSEYSALLNIMVPPNG